MAYCTQKYKVAVCGDPLAISKYKIHQLFSKEHCVSPIICSHEYSNKFHMQEARNDQARKIRRNSLS